MREVGIVGVPMDLGADRRGVDMGPYAIRYAGLERDLTELGWNVSDFSNLQVPGPESRSVGDERAKYESAIEATCLELQDKVATMVRADQFPLVLGGDHAIAMGTVAGLLTVKP